MKRIWITKDGHHLKIKDMATSHIRNCIKMLERAKEEQDLHAYDFLGFINGEIASEMLEAEADHMTEETVEERFPVYEALKAELERREALEKKCLYPN